VLISAISIQSREAQNSALTKHFHGRQMSAAASVMRKPLPDSIDVEGDEMPKEDQVATRSCCIAGLCCILWQLLGCALLLLLLLLLGAAASHHLIFWLLYILLLVLPLSA
jgi:hypothetical protein